MPDYCDNLLILKGTRKELEEFASSITSGEETGDDEESVDLFDFNKIIPVPEELNDINVGGACIKGKRYKYWRSVDGKDVGLTQKELDDLQKRHGAVSCYDFCCDIWGTKWGAMETNKRLTKRGNKWELSYEFVTAWGPPTGIRKRLEATFPTLSMQWMCKMYGEPYGEYEV